MLLDKQNPQGIVRVLIRTLGGVAGQANKLFGTTQDWSVKLRGPTRDR